MSDRTIAFIGLGAMGSPMAQRLIAADFDVRVHDAAPGRTREFVESVGGMPASNSADAAREADIVVTMLPSSAIVEAATFGVDGIAETVREGTLLIEMSSGVPRRTRDIGKRLTESTGTTVIDAPVSGGVPRARTGELAIMVGGEDSQVARAQPILTALGTTIHHTGKLGTGQAMKALNNLTSAAGLVSAIETLMAGVSFGLEPAQMVQILNDSTGASNSTRRKLAPYVLSGTFDSGFGLDLLVKDIDTALEIIEDEGLTRPLSALTRDLWRAARESLGAARDHVEYARYAAIRAGSDPLRVAETR